MSDSPFLQSLLRGIERNAEVDLAVLQKLVFRTLTNPMSGFLSLDVSGVEHFPLTKGEVFRFLRETGLERWHTATWLKFDAGGEIVSDLGVDININGPEADARLLQLTEMVWVNMSVRHPPVHLDDGTLLIVLREHHLVTLLEVARDIARRNPDWAAAQAQSAMRHVIADASSKSMLSNRRNGGTQGSRP